jgi:hypothetical protein
MLILALSLTVPASVGASTIAKAGWFAVAICVVVLFTLSEGVRRRSPLRRLAVLERDVASLQAAAEAPQVLTASRSVLLPLLAEMEQAEKELAEIERAGSFGGFSVQLPADARWKKAEPLLVADPSQDGLYRACAAAYQEVARINSARGVKLFSGTEAVVEPADRLPDALRAVRRARTALRKAVES